MLVGLGSYLENRRINLLISSIGLLANLVPCVSMAEAPISLLAMTGVLLSMGHPHFFSCGPLYLQAGNGAWNPHVSNLSDFACRLLPLKDLT